MALVQPHRLVLRADRIQLASYRAQALDEWARGFFGPSFPDLDNR